MEFIFCDAEHGRALLIDFEHKSYHFITEKTELNGNEPRVDVDAGGLYSLLQAVVSNKFAQTCDLPF